MIIQKQELTVDSNFAPILNIECSINVEQVMDDFALLGNDATYTKLGKLIADELMFGGLLRESSHATKH
jgi:hypothetical protein